MSVKILFAYLFATFLCAPPHFRKLYVTLVDACLWGAMCGFVVSLIGGASAGLLSAMLLTVVSFNNEALSVACESVIFYKFMRHIVILIGLSIAFVFGQV